MAGGDAVDVAGSPLVVRVATDIALDSLLDYSIPEAMRGKIKPGHRLLIPLGRREAVGVAVELAGSSSVTSLREVKALLDVDPIISPELMELAGWMAGYYLCPIEMAVRAVLPVAVRKADARHLTELVAEWTKPLVTEKEGAPFKKGSARERASDILTGGPMALAELEAKGVSRSVLRGLEKAGWVTIIEREVVRRASSQPVAASQPLTLNEEQQKALEAIQELCGQDKPKPLVLQGVTGSGKTEVYLQAISGVLSRGRGAIVLVPEISLTPQSVERFRARFEAAGVGVAVLHSHLSDGERHDEWFRIKRGEAKVVVGARSALFAPVEALGLIVVDEEHEGSYKQQEAPRYHARDVAVMRGYLEKVPVVLGSATPSLETWHNAAKGKYIKALLSQRVDAQKLPLTRVIDMRYEKASGGVFSRVLEAAIGRRLDKGEQTILFLNRRGFAPSVLCQDCGHVVLCKHCSIALTVHLSRRKALCHMCGHEEDVPSVCPACGSKKVLAKGFGTERVEKVVRERFPKARVARMDSDTMTGKGSYEYALGEFREGRTDILVGTQMIAKGLHFPGVTLVGVLAADRALHMPDFRASERVFQILTQVAGRAGRGDAEGEVIVQSYTPFHPAVQFAKTHDVEGFYEEEIVARRDCGYPPWSRLVLVSIRSRHADRAQSVAEQIGQLLEPRLGRVGAALIGVVPAPIEKVRDQFRWQVLIKCQSVGAAAPTLRAALLQRWSAGVHVSADVDALQFM